jgi:cold shock CspA family protein
LLGIKSAKWIAKSKYIQYPAFQILRSTISHVNQYRGIGFISHQPENLYFHQAFLEDKNDFDKLEVGTEVEFLIGMNDEGERIARKLRPITTQSTVSSVNKEIDIADKKL